MKKQRTRDEGGVAVKNGLGMRPVQQTHAAGRRITPNAKAGRLSDKEQ